jgi:hypothetical protein
LIETRNSGKANKRAVNLIVGDPSRRFHEGIILTEAQRICSTDRTKAVEQQINPRKINPQQANQERGTSRA